MRVVSDAATPRSVNRVLARLSRRTTSGRYIPEIDGLRFVCIGLVLLFHVRATLGFLRGPEVRGFHGHGLLDAILGQGQFGVELFFVISGFVLALPFVAHHVQSGPKPSLRRYYARRLTRLEPPYLIVIP